MGFHQYNTNFTLDPRVAMTQHKNVSRGLGNQVTVEFNLLYRFHCAISQKDEKYSEDFMRETYNKVRRYEKLPSNPSWDPKTMNLPGFLKLMGDSASYQSSSGPDQPWNRTFGLTQNPKLSFKRNPITSLFNDQQMVDQLIEAMDDPISNFGPLNVPKCLKNVEIMGILQARKWEIGTLNDFRDFFGLGRHESFESITKNAEVQDALRDLYEHPDKVELYPGIFCESDENKGVDPGPSDVDSALWAAIFSDAITLVRSDRFYTVDWNTNSLTSWGMKEVTPDNDVLKTSVFHRLLQRAFPEWFPYDSIRFFHPFYTGETNAKFAKEQGYAADFRMGITASKYKWGKPVDWNYHIKPSEPRKPQKPIYLTKYSEIAKVVTDDSDRLVQPARLELHNFPPKVAEILKPGQKKAFDRPEIKTVEGDSKALMCYFLDVMRDIVKRESITMNSEGPVYQIDATREYVILVLRLP